MIWFYLLQPFYTTPETPLKSNVNYILLRIAPLAGWPIKNTRFLQKFEIIDFKISDYQKETGIYPVYRD
jgi:hypothetical protein